MSKTVGTVNFRLLVATVFFAFVLAVCLGAGPVKTNSAGAMERKTCTLNMTEGLTVKRFDGEEVYWTAWRAEKIPAGSHTLHLKFYKRVVSGGAVALEDIVVTYDRFKAGHAYLLTAQFGVPASPGMMIGVGIKDITNEPDWAAQLQTANWGEGFEWLPATKLKATGRSEKSE